MRVRLRSQENESEEEVQGGGRKISDSPATPPINSSFLAHPPSPNSSSDPPVAICVALSDPTTELSLSEQATLQAIMASSALPACLQAK